MESITWVGLDAHKGTIFVAAQFADEAGAVTEWKVANERQAVRRLARKLVRKSGDSEVRCCYEAGSLGFGLARELEGAAPGLVCEVVAPSLIPKMPGERVKTDRRDGRKLLHLNRSGLLTVVHQPTVEQEAVRDLCRGRETLRGDVTRCRHRITKFLDRRSIRWEGPRKHWTKQHREWLRGLRLGHEAEQAVLDDFLLGLEQHEERLKALDEQIETWSRQEPYSKPVGALRCFRGIDTLTAMTIVTELGDVRRFDSAPALMSYLGLTASEYSSGDRTRRGRITRTGNSHIRRVLIESAWHYRNRVSIGAPLRRRREGQPGQIIAMADKAQHRLHSRYWRLVSRGKLPTVAAVAVARELVGFIWAALREEGAVPA